MPGQLIYPIAVLAAIWLLQSAFPWLERGRSLRHAARNLTLGVLNAGIAAVAFATLLALATEGAARYGLGLAAWLGLGGVARLLALLLLFDAWMYAWHRLNHRAPWLWRFHRAHHSDPDVDVTTALRFHPGEIVLSAAARLLIVPLLGMRLGELLVYEAILFPVIAFHHSNVALPERWDRWLRWLIVTPGMHRVHHSDYQPETDSNYASILSVWDRLFVTLRDREDARALHFGLAELAGEEWQDVGGILRTPLAPLPDSAEARPPAVGRQSLPPPA